MAFTTPLCHSPRCLPQVIFIFSLLGYEEMLTDRSLYPQWSISVGWALTASSLLCIPVYVVYKISSRRAPPQGTPRAPSRRNHRLLPWSTSWSLISRQLRTLRMNYIFFTLINHTGRFAIVLNNCRTHCHILFGWVTVKTLETFSTRIITTGALPILFVPRQNLGMLSVC